MSISYLQNNARTAQSGNGVYREEELEEEISAWAVLPESRETYIPTFPFIYMPTCGKNLALLVAESPFSPKSYLLPTQDSPGYVGTNHPIKTTSHIYIMKEK